jgi:hypothetical protein
VYVFRAPWARQWRRRKLRVGRRILFVGGSSQYAAGAFISTNTTNLTGVGSLNAAGALTNQGAPIDVALIGIGISYAAAGEVQTTVFLPSMTTGAPFAAGALVRPLGGPVSLIGAGSLFGVGQYAGAMTFV